MSSGISNQYSNRAELADQYKAQETEKHELEAAHTAELENLKKSYAAEKADLQDRYESSIQSDKAASYDHLRNLKSQLTREERSLQNTKNQVIHQKTDDFKHEEIAAERDGSSRVKNAIQKYTAAEETERSRAMAAENEIKGDHHRNAEHLIADSQKRLHALSEEKATYLETQKDSHAKALGEIEDHYKDARARTVKQYGEESGALASRATREMNAKRMAASSILQKFDQQHEDPFYQIKRFESDLLDIGDAYVLRVKVPEYERGHFKVEVAGQEIQLKGVRSSDETAKIEAGREISTRTFQNISERYALAMPVDGHALTYKEEGEWLEYHLPKFGPGHRINEATQQKSMAEDSKIANELNFAHTLPTPTLSKKTGNETLS